MNIGGFRVPVAYPQHEEEDIFDPEKDDISSDSSDEDHNSDSEKISPQDNSIYVPWHPDYKESDFIKIADFILNCVNPYFDLIRTSIPSSEEMLIRNLPGIRGKTILINKLKQMDIDEELILQSEEEKYIDALRNKHLIQANGVGVTAGLFTGAIGIVCSFASKITLTEASIAALGMGLGMKLCSHSVINKQEIEKKYILIRIQRLKEKFSEIGSFLDNYNELELKDRVQARIVQLNIARFGLKRIIHHYVRIYNNSTGNCDKSVLPPKGYLEEIWGGNKYKGSFYGTRRNPDGSYEWVRTDVYSPLPGKTIYHPPPDIEKKLYRDVRKIERQGHKVTAEVSNG